MDKNSNIGTAILSWIDFGMHAVNTLHIALLFGWISGVVYFFLIEGIYTMIFLEFFMKGKDILTITADDVKNVPDSFIQICAVIDLGILIVLHYI